MHDERNGCPSASILPRLAKCPGSWRLSRLVSAPASTEDARSGTRIHDAIASDDDEALTSDEEAIRASLKTLEQELFATWLAGAEPERLIREERFWRKRGDTPLWSAKPDVVALVASEALIIEYKTGPIAVENAAENLQLRAQAAVVHQCWPQVRRVTVAILQPRCSPPLSQCLYQTRDLERALDEVDRIVAQATWEDAPLRAGEAQCRYCPAKPVCPQAHEEVAALVETKPPLPTPARIAELLNRCVLAEQVIESIREYARRIIADDPYAIPGWRLAPGRTRESITNLQRVFERVHRLGSPPDQFVGACSLTKKSLKTLLQKLTGEKGALLDARLAGVIDGCIEESQGRPMLVRQETTPT